MTDLIDRILEKVPYDTITDTELFALLERSIDSKYGQLKRALKKGDLVRLRRGVYQLNKRYQRQSINPFCLAQKIYGPSYISFESALSYHGLIPEAVYTVTSTSLKRSREFQTPLGVYSYVQVPQTVFYAGVNRVEQNGQVFLVAGQAKALADYIFVNKLEVDSLTNFLESLRIDKDDLKISAEEIQELISNYKLRRVKVFLEKLGKA